MAINKAMYNGVQDIMNAYDRNANTPYYSVWAGRDMVFSYNEDDAEKGRIHLLENLIACEQNEHTDILKIKFHPKKEKTFITDKSPSISTLFVRVCDVNNNRAQLMPMQPNYAQNNQIATLLEKQNEIISGLHNRLSLLETEETDNDYDNETELENTLGKINGILNHPVTNMVLGLLIPALPGLMKANTANTVTSLAGVEPGATVEPQIKEIDEQTARELESALIRLNAHVNNLGETLTKLADYADKNTAQFNMLLKML